MLFSSGRRIFFAVYTGEHLILHKREPVILVSAVRPQMRSESSIAHKYNYTFIISHIAASRREFFVITPRRLVVLFYGMPRVPALPQQSKTAVSAPDEGELKQILPAKQGKSALCFQFDSARI
jgi:hypothetical protein